ncbi:hypothetical protein F4780DRAFT_787798, partial [Xylariomycetidae sp. FL0641]
SEARAALALRAPADVVNLLHVWGLPAERGTAGLAALPRSVVVNEGLKRRGFRGVVDVVAVAERPPGQQQGTEVREDKGNKKNANANANAAAAGEKKEKGKKSDAGGGGGKKRKNGDADQEGENIDDDNDGDEAPMSKRRAKKLKAALRKKQAEGSEIGGT